MPGWLVFGTGTKGILMLHHVDHRDMGTMDMCHTDLVTNKSTHAMALSIDLLLAGITDVTTALQNPSANSPLALLSDSQSAALQQLMTILHSSINHTVLPALSSLATTVPALRVPAVPAEPTPHTTPVKISLATNVPSLRVPTVSADPTSIISPDRLASPGASPLPQLVPHIILDDHTVIPPTNDKILGTTATKSRWPDGPHLIPDKHDDLTVPASNSSSKHTAYQCH